MTFSTGMLEKGVEWHPGCLVHDSSTTLDIAGLRKYSHECDILHLQTKETN